MNILDVLDDITDVVVESMIDVYYAMDNYNDKNHFINDYNNNVEIPSIYVEMMNNDSEDEVIMEEAVVQQTDPFKFDKDSAEGKLYKDYRFDFLAHNSKGAKNNRTLAECIVSAFLASHEAKKQKNGKYNPIADIEFKRTHRMDEIIKKLYDGKSEAVAFAVNAISTYKHNKSCFIDYDVIPFNAAVDPDTNQVPGNLIDVRFKFKLPEKTLNYKAFITLEKAKLRKTLELKKQDIIRTSGQKENDPRAIEITNEIKELNTTYSLPNEKTCVDLARVTCYTDVMSEKKLVDYKISMHLLKRDGSSKEEEDNLNSVNAHATINTPTAPHRKNSTQGILALSEYFDLKKKENQ